MRPIYPFQWVKFLEKLGFWSGETTQAAIDAVSMSGATWGSVSGTLSDQTDLQTELDRKLDASAAVTDHGALSGLADDDHTQYHNDTRGDARYYTQSQVDTALAGKQPLNAGLTAISALTPTSGYFVRWSGATTATNEVVSSFALTFLDDTDAASVRTTIGAAASVDIPTIPEGLMYRRMSFYAYASGNHTLTNQVSGEQFLANSSRNVKLIDLSPCTEVRFNVRVVTGSASVNNPRLIVKYATSWTTTLGSYSDIGTSEVSASLATATLATSGWIDLAAGAQIESCYVTVVQIGGDGVADPAFAHVDVEFR